MFDLATKTKSKHFAQVTKICNALERLLFDVE